MKRFKYIILGVIMATFMSTILGCSAIDNRVIEPIKNTLSEKYGKSFTVAEIGDRIDRDTATAYVYADDNPSMRFTVIVDKSGEIIYEEYLYRLMCRQVEDKINQTFEKYHIMSECFVTFTPRKNLNLSADMSFEEFVKANSFESALASMVVLSDDNLTGENIVKVYTEVCNFLEDIDFGTCLYVLSRNDFEMVKGKIRCDVESFALQDLKYYGASGDIKELYIKAENKEMPLTSSDLDFELGKV